MSGGLQYPCYFCNAVIIGSKLFTYGRGSVSINYPGQLREYNIIESDENFHLELIRGTSIKEDFGMKDPVFLLGDEKFPNLSCNVGFRVENNACEDINECEILRHYCDSARKRFKFIFAIYNM